MYKKQLLFAACVLISGCANTNPSSSLNGDSLNRASTEAAEAAIISGDPAQASVIYMNQYEKEPNAITAINVGRSLRLSGSAQKGVLFLQTAVKKYPRNGLLLTELARSSLAGGYLPEAAQALNEASQTSSSDWTTWLVYGAYSARMGDYSAADSYFQKAESLAPSPRQALSARANRGLVMAERGDLMGAVSDLRNLAARPGADPRIGQDLSILQSLNAESAPASDARTIRRRNIPLASRNQY